MQHLAALSPPPSWNLEICLDWAIEFHYAAVEVITLATLGSWELREMRTILISGMRVFCKFADFWEFCLPRDVPKISANSKGKEKNNSWVRSGVILVP